MANLPPEAYALLDAISGPESKGRYNVRYGGAHFDSYDDHPRIHKKITSGPNKGKTSSAAGRYQITETTWNRIQPRLNLPDFSPQSQDIAAWYLAQKDYGGNLLGDLRSGDPNVIGKVAKKLANVWTSLPGGIEATTTTSAFNNAYHNAFLERNVSPVVPPPPNRGTAAGAIETLLANSSPTATAYAPSAGSLSASPLAAGAALPNLPSRVSGVPLRPTAALPPLPPGRATDLPSVRAFDVPPMRAIPPRLPLPAVEPLVPTIRATDLNPDTIAPKGPVGRGSVRPPMPPSPPPLTEEALTKWAANNFVPAPRNTGLTTRSVTSIPITPDSPLAGGPDLKTALEDYAATRRAQLPGMSATSQPPVRAAEMTFREINKGTPSSAYPTAPPLPSATIRAADLNPDLLSPATGPGGRGRSVLTAPKPPSPNLYADSPVFGNNPNLAPLTPQPPGMPSAVPSWPQEFRTALRSPIAPPPVPSSTFGPLVAADEFGDVGRMFDEGFNGAPKAPRPKVNVPAQPPAPFIPASAANDFIRMSNSPGVKFLGETNNGQHPLAKMLMSLFAPRPRTEVSTALANLSPAARRNQSDAAAEALSRGRNSYSVSSGENAGALYPTVSVKGKIRNTYGD